MLVLPAAAAAQSFEHYYSYSGLSQSTILSICKDSTGFMWFGTRDGLNRFDGNKFKVYAYDPANTYSISSSDYIYTLYTDKAGNLWVGTRNGLNRYLPDKDGFERIFNSGAAGSLSDNNVYCIDQDHAGRLWMGTNRGLNMLASPDSRHFIHFGPLEDLKISTIYEDDRHNIWLGASSGLVRMWQSGHHWQFQYYRHQDSVAGSLADNAVKTITGDKAGNIWIGMEDGGMDRLYVPTGVFTHYRHSISSRSISSNNVRKIIQGNGGKLWVATIDGLNIFDTVTKAFKVIRNARQSSQSLSDNSIKDIYRDDAGSLWIGTMYGGVNVLHVNTIPFTIFDNNPFSENNVSGNIISAILPDNDNIWIGTEGSGLNLYNKVANRFTHYRHEPDNQNSIAADFIKALVRGPDGNIWIGSYLGGVDMLSPVSHTFTHYRHVSGNPNTLSSDNMTSLFIDAGGRLWAGTAGGLNFFDASIGNFRRLKVGELADNDLCSQSIRAIYQDHQYNFWVGTVNGLNLLRKGSRQWEEFLKTRDVTSGAISGYINCIFEDKAGSIWIGSYRGGLSLYLPASRSFKKISVAEGLPSNNVLGIQQDNAGLLWISTDKGLASLNPRTLKFKKFDVNDGLPSNEFNYNSSAKDKEGNLYFGSYGGLVSFLPNELSQNNMPPKIVLTDIKIFNKSILDSNNRFNIASIATLPKIRFKYDQNVFTINFAALNYIHPKRNRYAYKLQGFEKDWNYVSEPAATYMNLPAGRYVLLIKGANNDGVWSQVYQLKISVLPPWWRTWWAYCLYVMSIAAVLIYTIRFFKRQAALKRDLYHEQLHSKRTEELYQLKLDFFTKVSHEIRTPLTLIIAPLEKVMDTLQSSPLVMGQITRIRMNAHRLLKLVNELLDYRKLNSDVVQLHTQNINLAVFSKDIYESFRDMAKLRHIQYDFRAGGDGAFAAIDPLQFEKVLYNLIINAFKYTPDGGRIEVSIQEAASDHILIQVCDNGIGVPLEKQAMVFDDFYQVDARGPSVKGWGIGLSLVKKIMLLHKGDAWIEAQPQALFSWASTCFSLRLHRVSAPDANGAYSIGAAAPELHPAIPPPAKAGAERPPATTVAAASGEKHHPQPEPALENDDAALLPDNTAGERPVVLVIEDEADVREFIKESLKHLYDILESDTGQAGLEMALSQIPDLVISDVNMPVMDGLELCKFLKTDARTSHIPIILLTAQTAYTQKLDGLQKGADLYITKPFSLQILELSIKNLLSLAASMRKKFGSQYYLMPTHKSIESVEEQFLEKVIEIIERNMDEPDFKVTDLAREIGMSQTVLYKKLKALTDLTITEFIKSIRLKRSAQLLESSVKAPISEIAYMVGFSDPKYFAREFRKQYGKSPSEYASTVKTGDASASSK